MATLATYDGSVDNTNNISTTAWWAQGFKIPAGSTISGFAIKGSRGSGATGTFRVRIYEGGTDTNCDGGTLVKDETFDISILPVYTASPVLSTVTFTSATAELTGGSTQYYLTISCPTGSPTNDVLRWSYDSTSPSYADGTASASTDGGATWTNYSTLDLNFSIFGGQYLLKNLVSYWKLEETNTTRVDSWSAKNLTDINSVPNAVGLLNNCADFDGTSDRLDRSATTWGVANSWTISMWVNPDAFTGNPRLFHLATDVLPNHIVFGLAATTGYTYINLYNSSSTIFKNYTSTSAFTTGSWQMLTYTWDGTTLKGYRNASELSFTKTTDSAGTQTDTSRALNVGATNAGTAPYNGKMDELAWWGRALTADEVTRLYNSGSGLAYEDLGTAPSSTTYNEARRMFMMMM